MYNKGKIFNIQRFSTSDGSGIRTVVFLKGCPLSCVWCHNPESQSVLPEIFYKKDMCIGCGACINECVEDCHVFNDGTHFLERKNCIHCAKCVGACSSNALEVCGEEKSAEEIIEEVLRDKPFYEESEGGVTLSGGEPLMQYDFTLSLLKLAKNNGLHTAIETSGFSYKNILDLAEYTDLWLYDIKIFPDDEHIKYTGVSNKAIFDNLHLLDKSGADIVLRCPIIPDINMNDEHFDKLVQLANSLSGVLAIHLEPYHPLGISKAEQLSKLQSYQNKKFLEKAELEPFADMLRVKTDKEVIII